MGGRGQSSATSKRAPKGGRVQRGHLAPGEAPKTDRQIAAYLGTTEKAARDMAESVRSFTGKGYRSIRAAQNGEDGSPSARRAAEMVERYVDKAPKWAGGTTYRGIMVDGKTAATYAKGAIIDVNRGTASWSTSETTAQTFADSIDKKPGTKSVVFVSKTQSQGTSIKHLSKYSHENEVLVSKRSRYRVTGVSEKGRLMYVYVDEA